MARNYLDLNKAMKIKLNVKILTLIFFYFIMPFRYLKVLRKEKLLTISFIFSFTCYATNYMGHFVDEI